ncbi:hypothetical protein BN137_421 [Cronobacter condimenti 1330]|uniref:Uncharacterized protein n=1 Tax=Cronobacter condimenti 1330 TaxID=1073999 RepID=K7ZXN8_9ENTR|nr:hypothetical protein BN137_421 [Cronobacter condimenti 1330]
MLNQHRNAVPYAVIGEKVFREGFSRTGVNPLRITLRYLFFLA